MKYLKISLMFGASAALIGFFLQALLNPVANANWIYTGAMAIFLIEFLSVHSSGMITGMMQDKKKALEKGIPSSAVAKNKAYGLVLFYGIFAVTFAILFKVWFLPLYFIISTFIKINEVANPDLPAKKINQNIIVISVLIFLTTSFFTAYTASLWSWLFPFPEVVLAAKPANASGIFIDTPQVLLVWGVIYFTIHLLINIYILVKPKHSN